MRLISRCCLLFLAYPFLWTFKHFVLVEQLERNFEMFDKQQKQSGFQQAHYGQAGNPFKFRELNDQSTQPVNIHLQASESVFSQDDTDPDLAFSGVLADTDDSTTVRVIACESEDEDMENEITPVTVHLQTPTRRSHSFDM